jgi:hypothetical protein
MTPLQTSLPYSPLSEKPLPGIAPLEPANWLWLDEAYSGQLAEKQRFLSTCRDDILMQNPMADEAAAELLDVVVEHLIRDHSGFSKAGTHIRCPDGRAVDLSATPLEVLAGLVQEDFCILQKPDGAEEHILTAGLLAFPASWRLSEKFMKPLTGIHVPVASYDVGIARRVQRLFDGIQVGRPLWRYNALWYQDPELHQPRSETAPRPISGHQGPYLRSERQTLLRLPLTKAVVFGIHTFVLKASDVPLAEQQL